MPGSALPRRFYRTVELAREDGGYCVLLDAKPVRTPARSHLTVEYETLANEIAAEWDAQKDEIDPASMPMTRRANTALDRVRGREHEIVAEIAGYAQSDLLCYRAETPEGLARKQDEHWTPVLEWAAGELQAHFETRAGIAHIPQPETSLANINAALLEHDFYALTPLHTMTTLTGSALLALAHARGHLAPDEAWTAAHVDEDWQIARWGEDAEAQARRTARRAEFDADVRFLQLVRG